MIHRSIFVSVTKDSYPVIPKKEVTNDWGYKYKYFLFPSLISIANLSFNKRRVLLLN